MAAMGSCMLDKNAFGNKTTINNISDIIEPDVFEHRPLEATLYQWKSSMSECMVDLNDFSDQLLIKRMSPTLKITLCVFVLVGT